MTKIDGQAALISASNPGALERVGALAETAPQNLQAMEPDTGYDVLSKILVADVNKQIASMNRRNSADLERGRVLGVALRAFGLALDIAANKPGMPDGQEFHPYTTNLGDFLKVPILKRRSGFTVESSLEPRINLGRHDTVAGELEPRFVVDSSIGTLTARKNAKVRHTIRRESRNSLSPFRYGGPLLQKPLFFSFLHIGTRLEQGEGFKPNFSEELPNLTVVTPRGYWGEGAVKLKQRRTRPVTFCTDDYVSEYIDAATASSQLDRLEIMMEDLPERPGRRLVEKVRDEIIET